MMTESYDSLHHVTTNLVDVVIADIASAEYRIELNSDIVPYIVTYINGTTQSKIAEHFGIKQVEVSNVLQRFLHLVNESAVQRYMYSRYDIHRTEYLNVAQLRTFANTDFLSEIQEGKLFTKNALF